MMLSKLIRYSKRENFDIEVISLTGDGPVGTKIRHLNIPVIPLGMPVGRLSAQSLLRLYRHLRKRKPELVQTWLYHANLIGGVVARLAGVPCVCWNIHTSNLERKKTKWHTRQSVRACAFLSHFVPSKINFVSKESAHIHQLKGYSTKKFNLIPNGFDVDEFVPDANAGLRIRMELDIPLTVPILGHVGRFDPLKNHTGLLKVFAKLIKDYPEVHLVCCGTGVTRENQTLKELCRTHSMIGRVHLLGNRNDIPALMNSFDVLVLPSYAEAFPNVLGEAMACGIPCMVTDVGDCSEIVSESGWVVPPGDDKALEKMLRKVLALPKSALQQKGQIARAHIIKHYRIEDIVKKYETLYDDLLSQ